MDWSEKINCIRCEDGENLLICSENDCPLALHEKCLGFPATFDKSGRFYCPFCFYKQAVAESRKAREYALAKKKALLAFLNEKEIDWENYIGEDNVHNHSKTSEANVNFTSNGNGESKSNTNGIIDKAFQLDGEEKINNAENNSEDSVCSMGEDPSLEMLGKSDRIEEKPVQEEEHEASAEEQNQEAEHESLAGKQIQEADHETLADQILEEGQQTLLAGEQIKEKEKEHEHEHETLAEEQIQEEKDETSSASTEQDSSHTGHARAKKESKRNKPVDKDSDADANTVRSKRLKQHDEKKQTSTSVTPTRRSSRRSSVAMRTEKN